MLSFIFTYMGFVSNFLIRMQKFVAKIKKKTVTKLRQSLE